MMPIATIMMTARPARTPAMMGTGFLLPEAPTEPACVAIAKACK